MYIFIYTHIVAPIHKSYNSNKIIWVWIEMIKLKNAKCCMKMDRFFLQYLRLFTFALDFLYFVAQYDFVKPY